VHVSTVWLQGRLLPTPELVPFRLTRDFVAAMGVCGIDGPYTMSSQVCMEVLRNNIAALLVVVEVFLHDPLYDWALSPMKLTAFQEDESAMGPSASVSSVKNPAVDATSVLVGQPLNKCCFASRESLRGIRCRRALHQ
jgi:phosphatidylinositol kinase/protein kinase (PI-3  family)